jgi:hypothetical protein
MPPSRYTNVRSLGGSPITPRVTMRQTAPYVSSGHEGQRIMPLTRNEREARRQQRVRTASQGGGGRPVVLRTAADGFVIDPISGRNTVQSGAGAFFSPQLSTDFLELPQSLREKREIYRHFYNTDPLVGQAIDLHTELPLSKVRLAAPKPRTHPKGFKDPEDYGKYILSFFEKMCKRIKLFQRLITSVHHLWLDGTVFIFAEDAEVQVPTEIGHTKQVENRAVLEDNGETREETEDVWVEKADREDEEFAYYQKHYQGWSRMIIFPIDQVNVTTFSYTDKMRVELIPADRDRALLEQAKQGDPVAEEMVNEIPPEVREHIENGRLIPLGTDPDEGSFVYPLCARKGAGEEMGQSILDRCLRTLYYKEKLRQAQTQIADRAMTPRRVVWAEDISETDAEDLREQVDLALVDPDYSIVTNYEVHWEEMSSKDRLLDLSTEYEICDKQLYAGLGVTESLISGEALYSGDRLKLEVINTRYLFLREVLQEYVEEYLFKPVARRKGFIEQDEWGEEVVLFPRLSFTRLPLRDSQDTYDALFNLYQKGSISIDLILEMFNIDPHDTRVKIERDMWTVNDATFNELIRGVYGAVAQKIADSTDLVDKLVKYMGLKPQEPDKEPEGRFE